MLKLSGSERLCFQSPEDYRGSKRGSGLWDVTLLFGTFIFFFRIANGDSRLKYKVQINESSK